MAALHAVYYRAPDGNEPVRAYLDDLDDEVAAVLAQQIDRLNLLTDELPHLPSPTAPRSRASCGSCCHYGRQLYRVLYRRSDRLSNLTSFACRAPVAVIGLSQSPSWRHDRVHRALAPMSR